MNDKKKDILVCAITGVVAILVFCLVIHVWNIDLNVPLQVGGDVTGILMNLKATLRDEKWGHFTGLGAPFYSNLYRAFLPGYQDGYIPNLIMYLITIFTNSMEYGINGYYIISSGLSAVCAYYMIRKSEVKRPYSFAGAIIYALIPGHFLRSEFHLYIGSCFSLPLIVVVAENVGKGKTCKDIFRNKDKLSFSEVIKSNSREQNLGLLFFALITFCTIYYGVFSLMLLTFCTVYCLVENKKVRYIFYYFQYVVELCVCVLVIYLPKILANQVDPLLETIDLTTRSVPDVEVYGGKFIQYIMPVSGHRISLFSKVSDLYSTQFPLVNENSWASLGAIMSIGFVIGILVCFFNKGILSKKLDLYGKMELFMFCVSTVGGLGAVVGLIYYNIRCYNRFSFLIGAVGIVISMKLLQRCCDWIINHRMKRIWKQIIPIILCLGILVIAILDQTTVNMAYTKDTGKTMATQYKNDSDFVKEIEAYEGDNANILVFPITAGQQVVSGTTDEGLQMLYNDQVLFLHSETSNWSIGSRAGEKGDRWLNWLKYHSVEEQIKIAAVVGFSGIVVYHAGYTEDGLKQLNSCLQEQIGNPTIEDKNGTWSYYSINSIKSGLLSEYSKEKLEQLKEQYLEEFITVRTTGIYAQESWGRWAEKECTIICNNLGGKTVADLNVTIETPAEDGAEILVSCGNYKKTIVTNGKTTIDMQIPMEKGVNEIKFSSMSPDFEAVNDDRNLNIEFFDMSLTCNNTTVKLNDL